MKETSFKSLAIIPARGGSKRIPRKNIKDFLGMPMIFRAIDTCRASKLFDLICVSTDDEEIAKLSEERFACVPYIRQPHLATDTATTQSVIIDMIKHYQRENVHFKNVCCVYPCTPLLKSDDLISSFNFFRQQNEDTKFVFPVIEYSHPIQRSFTLAENSKPQFIALDAIQSPTQSLTKHYHDAGQYYWGTSQAWMESINMYINSKVLVANHNQYIDIDNEGDWKLAEMIFQQREGE